MSLLKIVLSATLDYIMTMHRFMEKLSHNDSSKSHVCEAESMTVEWGYRWNFPPLPFLSDVMSSDSGLLLLQPGKQTCLTRWYSGVKSLGWWNSSVQLRNFANSSSPANPQQKTGQNGLGFFYSKRGSSTVLFLFSQVGSCICAYCLRFQPSHMIV